VRSREVRTVSHLQIKSLNGTSYAWLPEVLTCFSDGDKQRYEQLCAKHADAMNSQPALVSAAAELNRKITIMCLVAMVSLCVSIGCLCSLEADWRMIPLDTSASAVRA
jgi:hypothetical protein